MYHGTHVAGIAAASGRNIIPADCEFFFDYRYVPGMPAAEFQDRITRFIDRVGSNSSTRMRTDTQARQPSQAGR